MKSLIIISTIFKFLFIFFFFLYCFNNLINLYHSFKLYELNFSCTVWFFDTLIYFCIRKVKLQSKNNSFKKEMILKVSISNNVHKPLPFPRIDYLDFVCTIIVFLFSWWFFNFQIGLSKQQFSNSSRVFNLRVNCNRIGFLTSVTRW